MTTTEPAPTTTSPAPGAAPTIEGPVSPTLRPRGVNHLAISTTDMKGQLTFFAEVLGCPTKALYWMHGLDGCVHGFVEMSEESYIAFVQHPENPTDIQYGITHAGNPGGAATGGAMQHLALHVDTLDEVLAMRDRIRSHGIQVMGPIDHGMIQSMYFAGPEGLNLEICCGAAIDETQWIDPEVQEICGISAEELEKLKNPQPLVVADEPVAQPATDASKPQMMYPSEIYEAIMGMSDADTWARISHTEPPVPFPD